MLLVKDIRNLQIILHNELLYSHIFITYMRGFTPSSGGSFLGGICHGGRKFP